MSDRLEPTAEDLAEMRDQALGNVDFEPTDDQLGEVCRRDPHLLALAMTWSWHDTEVREQLCAALTATTRTWVLTPIERSVLGVMLEEHGSGMDWLGLTNIAIPAGLSLDETAAALAKPVQLGYVEQRGERGAIYQLTDEGRRIADPRWHAVNETLQRAQVGRYEALLWPAEGDGGAWIVYHVLGAFVADRGFAADHAVARKQAETALRRALQQQQLPAGTTAPSSDPGLAARQH